MAFEQSAQKEKEYTALRQQSVLSWLKNGDSVQEEELNVQLDRCHPNTCDWLRQNTKTNTWLKHDQENKILWLKGKPGSGKTH